MSDRERDTKDIEARLRISEERLRLAETASGIGMFELDLVSDRWEWTPHVAVLFGLDSRIPGVLFADLGAGSTSLARSDDTYRGRTIGPRAHLRLRGWSLHWPAERDGSGTTRAK